MARKRIAKSPVNVQLISDLTTEKENRYRTLLINYCKEHKCSFKQAKLRLKYHRIDAFLNNT